ncbi:MAG: hypothetical protein KGS72_13575 [Cyanobacteria bacterium REEB67]|nr:hypothetical protein [Cyanobacteria bacterium REEB67]
MPTNVIPIIAIGSVSGLTSRHGRDPAWLTIANYTNEPYTVQWVDYDGLNQPCDTALAPYGTFTQRTFATHPFVLLDASGAIRYLLEPVAGNCVAYLEPEGNNADKATAPIMLSPEPIDKESASRSLSSDNACYLTVINNTDAEYKFFWLDFDGQRVEYNSVGPRETKTQCTYETHPWILSKVDTAEEKLYFPQKGICCIEVD